MNTRLVRAGAAALALVTALAAAAAAQQRPRRASDFSQAELVITVPEAAPENPEVAAAARAFGTLTREELRLWLAAAMPAPPDAARGRKIAADFRAAVCAAGPAVVDDDDVTSRVASALAPLLKFFNSSSLSVAVVRDAEPRVEIVLGAGLVITTGMLDAAAADDQLVGWAAHALAAATGLDRYRRAAGDDDREELRRITLERDAIAAAALAALGKKPALYADSVFAVVTSDATRARAHSGVGQLPSLRDRLRVIEMVAGLTTKRAAPQTLLASTNQ